MTRDEIEKLSDEELNVMVATEVMGLLPMSLDDDTNCPYCGNKMRPTIERAWCSVCHEWRYSPYMEYSSDIAAAMQVLETFDRREWDIHISRITEDEGEYWGCELTHYSETGLLGGSAASHASLPRAISIASVLAKMQP